MTGPGLRVLVTAASRHGSTHEIAAAIARGSTDSAAARQTGATAWALPAENRPDPSTYDAVVLGSAVSVGRWLDPARDLATAHAAALRGRPLWLFSSGIFPGRLDKALLSFGARAMVTAMRAPLGDFRDWTAVAAWGASIATELDAIISALPAAPAGETSG